nr:unnamed protein product [Digitaria exilis]
MDGHGQAITCATILLLVLLPPPCSAADDRLVLGKRLSPGATIVSDGGSFALGFFSPAGKKLYLGIWYNDIPQLTVVWVANRETPVTNNTSSPPTLSLTNTSNLVLSDADGRVVWTSTMTDITGGFPSITSPAAGVIAAVLLNTGNLVIRSPNDTTLWESFEHPTDTFLPTMKLGIRYKTRTGESLVSWKGPGDPSPGTFTYAMDPVTLLQLYLWNGTRPVLRNGPWTGYMVTSWHPKNTSSVILYQAVVNTDEEIYLTYTLSDGAPHARYVLAYSGELQFESWNDSLSSWEALGEWMSLACNRYGHCGPNGYCDNSVAAPACKCLDGFEPENPEEWSTGTFSQGCRRKEALRCGDGFVALSGMRSPDKFLLVRNRTELECADECSRNCSCMAYAYANLSSSGGGGSRATGDVTRCLVWGGELIDTAKIGDDVIGSETLFLRSAGLDVAGRKAHTNNAERIMLPTVLISAIIVLAIISLAWLKKFKGNKQKRRKCKIFDLGDLSAPESCGEGNPTENLEFPVASLRDVTTATNNFDNGYMAPEYAMRGIFSVKSDVYSFGVLTLETVSGVKISSTDHTAEFENLIVYAWNLWKEGLAKEFVDSSITGSCILDEALLCVHIGLLCVQDNPNDRPLMSSVVLILENGSTALPIPIKPVYFEQTTSEILLEQRRGNTQDSRNNVTLSALEGRCATVLILLLAQPCASDDRLVPGKPLFTYGADPDTFLQTFVWNGTRPMLRSAPWTGFMVDSQYQANFSAYIYVAVVNTDEDTYISYSLSDGAAHTRYVLSYSGEYQLQSWNSSMSAWAVLGKWPTWDCNLYGHCGPYGYCDSTMAAPTCRCLDGFEPASSDEWSSGRFSRGCRRKEAPRCNDGFLALPGMKSPDRFVLARSQTAGECAAECAKNCSCVAYAYADLSSGGTKVGETRCLVWTGDLIDTEKMGDMAGGGETLYLRSAGYDGSRNRANTNAVKIVLPTVLIFVGIILACFMFGDAFLQVFVWNATRPVWRSGPWTGNFVAPQYEAVTSIIVYLTVVDTQEESYMTFSLSAGSAYTRYVLTDSGGFELHTWNSSSSAWVFLWDWTSGPCSHYSYCGPNGYCDYSDVSVTCKCLEGFEPTSLEDWNTGRFSQGCRRKEALRCGDGFMASTGMKSPDKFVLVENRTFQECAAECAGDCSCVAYSYANLSTSRRKGDVTRCLVWTGELIDTERSSEGDGTDTLEPWTGYFVSPGYRAIDGVIVYLTVVNTKEEIYMTFSLSTDAVHTRYVLTESGDYQLQTWNNMSSAWTLFIDWTSGPCNRYSYCGLNGYCDNSNTPSTSTCKCLDGFEPTSMEDWKSGRFSQGCRRKEAVRCGDGFVPLKGMKSPDKFVLVENRTFQQCEAECARDCSCVAYAYANMSTSRREGDVTRCLVWAGELIDTAKIGEGQGDVISDTLYLRIAGVDAGRMREKRIALEIVLPAVLTSGLLILVSLAWFKFKAGTGDRLVPGKSLSPGATIVSEGGSFALGFFSPTNSTPAKLYLGIWYNDIPRLTAVWVANRGAPATNISTSASSSSPTAALSLTNTSNLVLSDAGGRVLWTTNITGAASAASAVLLNTGNLVIQSPNGTTLCQSFDNPTDTFLPGMNIGINYATRAGERLVSWKGPGDPSPGSFSLGLDPDKFLQAFIWNATRPVWRSGPWTGYFVSPGYQANVIVYLTVIDTQEEVYMTYSLSAGAAYTRYVLTDTGGFELHTWNTSSSTWVFVWDWTSGPCSLYGYCGPNGYCDYSDLSSMCKCLDGFEPTSMEEWKSARFSQGCQRKEALRCGDNGFVAVKGMKSPDKFVLVENRTLQECQAECTGNCSCVAYAYANLSNSRRKGDVTRCLVWAGDLIDTENIGEGDGSDTLYLRTAGSISDAGRMRAKRNALKIVLPAVLISCLLVLVAVSILAWFKFKGKSVL